MTPKRREAINLSWFLICLCFSKSLLIKYSLLLVHLFIIQLFIIFLHSLGVFQFMNCLAVHVPVVNFGISVNSE